MAEQELYNNPSAVPFPFRSIRYEHQSSIAEALQNFELKDTITPHATFVAALNSVLVWAGARTATLPAWSYMANEADIVNFLSRLNESSKYLPQVKQIMVLNRSQVYRSGDGIEQGLIVCEHNPRVRFSTDRPVRDDEIGRELDMYPPNCDFFVGGYEMGETAFSIWEVGTEALLYAEAWSDDLLTPEQVQEFLVYCEKRVNIWNAVIEKLGFKYCFYKTIDWK